MPTKRQNLLRWSHHLLLTTNLILLTAILLLWPLSHFQGMFIYLYPPDYACISGLSKGRFFIVVRAESLGPHMPRFHLDIAPPSDTLEENEWSYAQWNHVDSNGIARTWLGITAYCQKSFFLNGAGLAIPFSYLTLLLIYPALTYRRYRKSRHLHPTRAFPLDNNSPTSPQV